MQTVEERKEHSEVNLSTSIFAAVVVYNVSCKHSITCQALSKLRNVSVGVLVYDNSTSDFGNREYCKAHGWSYLGGNGNVGISKAYNSCISELKNRGASGILCLFDDDTSIDEDYFLMLQKEALGSKSCIFAPIVYSGRRLLSPCLITKHYLTKSIRNEAEISGNERSSLSAINSGMAIALSLFEDYSYDENIFLDGVDHHFVQDMAIHGNMLHIIPYKCYQEFSSDSKTSNQAALARFKIFASDYRYILRNQRRIFWWFLVGKRAVRLTAQYGSIHFLRVLLHTAISSAKAKQL